MHKCKPHRSNFSNTSSSNQKWSCSLFHQICIPFLTLLQNYSNLASTNHHFPYIWEAVALYNQAQSHCQHRSKRHR
ncbi:hypothetical protein VIGAN_04364300 [Vigna angularis var. angularis]|uniref:Uncharacterized protein n=1 Tax=Vigna angularis var. angularis TaxID=157739 RepID=A0A0S3RZR5_PHAAN|nr:hypothetical protein VIGAN_04364300 [Vigna angularis var. angularis]